MQKSAFDDVASKHLLLKTSAAISLKSDPNKNSEKPLLRTFNEGNMDKSNNEMILLVHI